MACAAALLPALLPELTGPVLAQEGPHGIQGTLVAGGSPELFSQQLSSSL